MFIENLLNTKLFKTLGIMEFPQKTKNGTACWPSNSTAGVIP